MPLWDMSDELLDFPFYGRCGNCWIFFKICTKLELLVSFRNPMWIFYSLPFFLFSTPAFSPIFTLSWPFFISFYLSLHLSLHSLSYSHICSLYFLSNLIIYLSFFLYYSIQFSLYKNWRIKQWNFPQNRSHVHEKLFIFMIPILIAPF